MIAKSHECLILKKKNSNIFSAFHSHIKRLCKNFHYNQTKTIRGARVGQQSQSTYFEIESIFDYLLQRTTNKSEVTSLECFHNSWLTLIADALIIIF